MKKEENKKDAFMKAFKSLCYMRVKWEVWEDMVHILALSLSLVVKNVLVQAPELLSDEWKARMTELNTLLEKYTEEERKVFASMARLLNEIIRETGDEYLGELYMQLGLNNHYRGQYFTPKHVAHAMARIVCTKEGVETEIADKGFMSFLDPCCGAGVLLLEAGKVMKECGANTTGDVLLVGQDIDWVAGLMCYIQISLAGYAGYVCIGNSLTHPLTGMNVLLPVKTEGQEFWFTPAWNDPAWFARRMACLYANETPAENEG